MQKPHRKEVKGAIKVHNILHRPARDKSTYSMFSNTRQLKSAVMIPVDGSVYHGAKIGSFLSLAVKCCDHKGFSPRDYSAVGQLVNKNRFMGEMRLEKKNWHPDRQIQKKK